MTILDNHFAGQVNESLQRVLFRSLKQENDEIFEDFIQRLRNHARSCNFADFESDIKDQIIGFAKSETFRKRALEFGKSELSKIIDLGKTLEAVDQQSGMFGKRKRMEEFEVNKIIDTKRGKWESDNQQSK